MCWICTNSEFKVAKEDIKVVKIVSKYDDRIIPYFYGDSGVVYGFIHNDGTYKPVNRVFIENFNTDVTDTEGYIEVYQAFHSYSPDTIFDVKKDKWYDSNDIVKLWLKFGNIEGYHDYYVFKKDEELFMDCIIPKGAVYAMNRFGEYVSNRLKVVGFREIEL